MNLFLNMTNCMMYKLLTTSTLKEAVTFKHLSKNLNISIRSFKFPNPFIIL